MQVDGQELAALYGQTALLLHQKRNQQYDQLFKDIGDLVYRRQTELGEMVVLSQMAQAAVFPQDHDIYTRLETACNEVAVKQKADNKGMWMIVRTKIQQRFVQHKPEKSRVSAE